jgi:gas vesicle protein
MGKFIIGLIVGIVVGVLAMTANPNLPEELRASLANLTAQVMRTAGDTAEDLGNAAEDAADDAGRAVDTEAPGETAPPAQGDQRQAPAPQ